MAIMCQKRIGNLYLLILLLAQWSLAGPYMDSEKFDSLSPTEMNLAVAILKEHNLLGEGWFLQMLSVIEPTKNSFYQKANPLTKARKAQAIVLNHVLAKTYQCIIDLESQKLIGKKSVEKGQPGIMEIEFSLVETAIKNDPVWQEAMHKRGFSDFDKIHVDNWGGSDVISFGFEKSHRVIRSTFYYAEDKANFFSQPIEGISTITDTNDGMRIKVIDTGIKPLPPNVSSAFGQNSSLEAEQRPLPDKIVIHGNQISWRKWQFHASVQPRDGLVISGLSLHDGQRVRPIIHRASLSEMVVPYSDSDEHWYFRAAFDEGEYGLGIMTTPLAPGVHAPEHAKYLDSTFANNDGTLKHIPNALAIFERDGGMLWSHHDAKSGKLLARASKELVLLHMVTISNYDYGMQWIFREDGSIELQMLLTGIIAVKASELRTCARCEKSPSVSNEADRFGAVVGTNLLGVSHQHFFNFRLDFAIDGTENQVAEIDFEPLRDVNANPHGNAFTLRKEIITSEKVSGRMTNDAVGRRWLVYNPNCRNRLGHFSGYMLVPGANTSPFAQDNSNLFLRAPFLKKSLWVTEYHAEEMYAAGDFPNQSEGDGVAVWVSRDGSLLNRSLVVWYTFGVTHLPGAEEWPIMPVSRAGFLLKPMGFFDKNSH